MVGVATQTECFCYNHRDQQDKQKYDCEYICCEGVFGEGTWCGREVGYIKHTPPNKEIIMSHDIMYCSLPHSNIQSSNSLCMVYIHYGTNHNSSNGHHFAIERVATGRDVYTIVATNTTHHCPLHLYLHNGQLLDPDFILADDLHLVMHGPSQ